MKGISASLVLLAGLAASTASLAQEVQPAAPPPTAGDAPKHLDAVVVSGRVSGPGLWQVYKDDSHDLWIMGTLSPLPAGIEWDATTVRELVAQADEVLWAPRYSVSVKANLFQQARLGFGYLRARKNPDGQSLAEVLPPVLHARWLAVKARYMPRNAGIERKRPLVAAEELLERAIEQARLSSKPVVHPAVKDIIEAGAIRSTSPTFEVKLTSDAARAALADMRGTRLDDAKCLEATLDVVENDLPRMVANANAWALGEVDGISFTALGRRDVLCSDALINPGFSEKYGLPNIARSVADAWLAKAESALSANAVTVAFVPMEQLVGPSGYLERLRALGYTVNAP